MLEHLRALREDKALSQEDMAAVQALEDFQAGKCLEGGQPAQDLTVGRWLRYWLEQVVKPSRSAPA